jgi:hypothetical protein
MRTLLLILVLAAAAPLDAGAQLANTGAGAFPEGDAAAQQADTVVADQGISPLGAFLRALVIPTWGHGALGSHRRGAFYMAAEGGTAWMLLRTASRRHSAERNLADRETAARAAAVLEPGPEGESPEEFSERIELAVEEDPRVLDARRRLDARQGQFEDWVAMGVFLTFLSGADAFVSAHLRDFPDPIDVQVGPAPGGGFQAAARVRVGGRPGH